MTKAQREIVDQCRIVRDLMSLLGRRKPDVAAEIIRVYDRTWSVAVAVTDGLAIPTEAFRARVLDLHESLWRGLDD